MPSCRTSRHFAKSCLYCCKAFHDRCVPPGTVANPFACLCPQHAYRQLPGETEDDVEKHLRSLGIDKAALLAGGGALLLVVMVVRPRMRWVEPTGLSTQRRWLFCSHPAGDDDLDDHHHLALALAADAGPSIVLSKMPPAKLAAAAKNILRKLRAPSIACLPPVITAAYDERHYRCVGVWSAPPFNCVASRHGAASTCVPVAGVCPPAGCRTRWRPTSSPSRRRGRPSRRTSTCPRCGPSGPTAMVSDAPCCRCGVRAHCRHPASSASAATCFRRPIRLLPLQCARALACAATTA